MKKRLRDSSSLEVETGQKQKKFRTSVDSHCNQQQDDDEYEVIVQPGTIYDAFFFFLIMVRNLMLSLLSLCR